MSDPAVGAAEKVWDSRYSEVAYGVLDSAADDGLGSLAISCAREALKPIRDLHKPGPLLRLSTAWMEGAKHECRHCRRAWPCATARLAYSAEELEGKS